MKSSSCGQSKLNKTLSLIVAICAFLVFGYTIYVVSTEFAYWQEILRDHFAAIIGLPGAAAVAFVLVIFLEQTSGPIELELHGLTLKGAAGQLVMWVICFIAIAAAIKLCW